ncbi:MAG TPA: glutamate-5-semialdehyde dehydrogenase [Clostridia bacterium]|nr:glutamate-5-semialdehyde dehydrogenase [Clostridia bacterium]
MSVDVVKICERAKQAAFLLAGYSSAQKNGMLTAIAYALASHKPEIFAANILDLENCKDRDDTFIDRLTLNDSRIATMIEGVKQVIALPDPVGEVVDSWTVENGLKLTKVRAPLGVIGIIYEARPNVTVDAAALCLKSGNAVVLRGSKDAINSNRALYQVMTSALNEKGYPADSIGFIDDVSREASAELLQQERYIDVVIPRGGEGLKHFVLDNAKMPVIASAGGNCHIYVEKTADLHKAVNIVVNAKISRPSTCNAAEHLLVDSKIAKDFLPLCVAALKEKNVELVGDEISREICGGLKVATEEDYATEYLTYKMSISIVEGVEEAVSHINKFSTKHSEAIITNDKAAEQYFTANVDAAAVYVNASTRFTDGFEFGLGAEMGISTQKLHARGPVALKELTSVKYVIYGNGQIRK